MSTKKEYEKPTATILNVDPIHSLEKVFAYDMESCKTSNESVEFDNIDEFKQLVTMINEYFIIAPELIISRYSGNYRENQLIKSIIEFYTSMLFINLEGVEDMHAYRNTIESVYNTFLEYGDKYYSHWDLLWTSYRDAITSILLVMSYLNDTDSRIIFNKLTQIGILNICACILMYNSLAWVEDED